MRAVNTVRTGPRLLTRKQSAFVQEYLVDFNGSAAAERAGFSHRSRGRLAADLLQKPHIQAAINAALAKRAERVELTQDDVLTGIREVVQRCMQKSPVLDSGGHETGEWKFESTAALKGLELLGKHLGMFRERLSLENPDGSALVEGNALTAMAAIVAASHGTVAGREASA